MPRNKSLVPEITVYLSSPSDVREERDIVKRTIREINADPSWQRRCVLTTLAYEDCVPGQMGKSAQRIVDDHMRLSSEADIVVCIFCNRLGTPTIDERTGKEYLSGTHYEFDSAYSKFVQSGCVSPRILLFLGSRDFPDESRDEDHDQYAAARGFKKRLKSEYDGLFVEYRELDQFENLVRDHLRKHLDGIAQVANETYTEEFGSMTFGHAVQPYLERLAANYCWLQLEGIREVGSLRIELEKVYVALKAEPETEYDRQQAANLHSVEVREAAGVGSLDVIDATSLEHYDADIIRRTYRPTREEAKRASVTVVRTLGDAFRQHRRIVILGGPGSGKTTIGRWLALQLARAISRQLDLGSPQRVEVPISQIDPDEHRVGEDLLDLGPARLPIFLRLAHFARELAERERQQQPSLALINYLGHDPDSRSLADGLTPETRNALFRSYLKNSQAVCILDGLDELSETNRRDVVLKIQDFIENHTQQDSANPDGGLPWEVGGNQVVVTSRYVGYKFAPVRAGCAHFGIQLMQRPAVERFSRAWAEAVNAELANDGQTLVVAERLIAEIYNEARPKVRELATNPLLVTILATVFWRDGRLPDQRAGVYDRVVENLLDIWLKRPECQKPGGDNRRLTREELLAALQPLAADMQENASSNGLISLNRIGELVEGPLAQLRDMKLDDPRFGQIREAILNTIRKHVGLLAEQSSGNYAFFHRTFQEFLAARHLLAHRLTAAEKLGSRIDDPLWREPLLLALGFAMIDPGWGPEARSRLLTEFLATDGPDSLIPRAALLLVAALPDLCDVPSAVVNQTAARLLTSYSISQDQGQAGVALREQIERAFDRLRHGRHVDPAARQFAESLRRSASGRDLSGAAATILRRINWFTTELVESLLVALPRDRAELDWPIHRALLTALGHHPSSLPWLSPSPELNLGRLLSTHLPMRKLLEANPSLVDLVHNDADWCCLLIALYGGLGHYQLVEQMEQRRKRRPSPSTVAVPVFIPPHEEASETESLIPPVEFSPQNIVHDLADSDLSRLIQRHLGAKGSARDLVGPFLQRWNSDGFSGAEAIVGLAALGEDIIPLMQAGLAKADRQPAVQEALSRFGWLGVLLREPLARSTEDAVRTLPEGIAEQHQLNLLNVALTARMTSGGKPMPVSDTIPEQRYVDASTLAVRNALEAEYWSVAFSGTASKDSQTPLESVIDRVTMPMDRLLHSWSMLPFAVNNRSADRLPWPLPILAPRADTTAERYLAMLDAMMSVPGQYHSAAGYVLGRCRPLLEEYPDLAWETLAVCWNHGREFSRGYRQAARGGPISNPPLGCQMPDELDLNVPWLPAGAELLQRILRIADPYLRFRALWLFGAVVVDEHNLDLDVLGLVERIPDAHDQVRAFEWIMMTIPPADFGLLNHVGLLDPIVLASSKVADAENRARAKCRLAFFAADHLNILLSEAIEALREIADGERRSETIREIREIWGRTVEVREALDAVAKTLSNPWQRDNALGRASRLVGAYRQKFASHSLSWRLPSETALNATAYRRPQPAGTLPWDLIYLSTTVSEVESLGATQLGVGTHWDGLLGAERSAAVAALVAAGLESGLKVTAREASILDRVVQSGQAAELEALWPILERPDPGAMGTIARWTGRRDGAGQWSALVQAEGRRLTHEIVASAIDLLVSSTDRLKMRAAIALHGSKVTPNKAAAERRWSVRQIGAASVNVLAWSVAQANYPESVRASLKWVHHDIHHDDKEAMTHWIAEWRSPASSWILESMESVESELIPLLLEALQTGSGDLQQTLLRGLARIAFCGNAISNADEALKNAVSKVPVAVRKTVRAIPDGSMTIFEIVKQAIAAVTAEQHQLTEARRLLEKKALWITEANDLHHVGKCFYPPSNYWAETQAAARAFAERADVLQLLLRWVEVESEKVGSDWILSHLLTATEALARISPDAYAAQAAPAFWEPLLSDAVQFSESYVTRMAAVHLMCRLRRVTSRVAHALNAAMNDVSFVQQAAYESVSEFRMIEGDILPDLLALLHKSSAGTVAAVARLLVGVARADCISADRRRIVRALEKAVISFSGDRPVFLMDWTDGLVTYQRVDRLDRILYEAIFEISGL